MCYKPYIGTLIVCVAVIFDSLYSLFTHYFKMTTVDVDCVTGTEGLPVSPDTLFHRPHTFTCDSYTVIRIHLDTIRRSKVSWDTFIECLTAEMAGLDIPRKIDADTIMYSTSNSIDKFSNPFNSRAITNLVEFDAAEAEAARLQAEHDEIEAAKPPKVIPEIQYDENGDEIPPKPKKKKEIKAEAEARKIDIERYQQLMSAHHKAEALSGKVRNSKFAHSIRVEHVA